MMGWALSVGWVAGEAVMVIAAATGRVVRFDEDKGYGFIAPNDGGEDVFVHANELTDRGLRVSTGTQVEFRVLDGGRGLKAYDVRILDDEERPPRKRPAAEAPAVAADGPRAGQQLRQRSPADDELCEIFSDGEFVQQITELLLTTAPQLTGAVIVELRDQLLHFARKNGWVE
jgi:cold shock protein